MIRRTGTMMAAGGMAGVVAGAVALATGITPQDAANSFFIVNFLTATGGLGALAGAAASEVGKYVQEGQELASAIRSASWHAVADRDVAAGFPFD